MRIIVALYKVDTQATQNYSVATRINNVKQALEVHKSYTESIHTAFWKPEYSGLRAVFLAPEYCFARSVPQMHGDHTFGMKRQMEEDYVKDKLRPVFSVLSQNFKNALIVPGTVAWRKSIVPSSKGKHASIEAAEQYRRDKYEQRIQATANINLEYNNNTPFTQNTPVFPTAFKKGDDTRPALPTAASKVQALQTAHYIAKNTAHCYYNGDCVYKYNKIGDFYEVCEDTTDTVIVPNRASKVSGVTVGAGRFSVAGLSVGISICYDQSLSVQQAGPVQVLEPLQQTAVSVDIHILLSAHIPPALGAANLKPGGVLLSCSSSDTCNGVLAPGAGPFQPDYSQDINGSTLDIYQLDWQ